jgi:hypothetical protein
MVGSIQGHRRSFLRDASRGLTVYGEVDPLPCMICNASRDLKLYNVTKKMYSTGLLMMGKEIARNI